MDFRHHTMESIDYKSGSLVAEGMVLLETSGIPPTTSLEQGIDI